MDRTSIDLRSVSCRGVRSFSLFQKPSLSAAVSVAGQKKRTAPDPDGGGNPEWAESFRFDLDPDPDRLPDLSLRVDVIAQGNLLLLLPDRVVGRVDVPVADLLREGGDGSVRHVSYRVEGTDGRPNGVITFSFNVNRGAVALPAGAGGYLPPPPRQLDPVTAFPAAGHYPPPRQQDPAISSAAAAGFYPPPLQQDPTMAPFPDRYPAPRQQYPATSAATEYYPPPRQHDPVVSSRAMDFYPPPRERGPAISSAVEEHHSTARRQYPATSSAATEYYPPPRQHDPVVSSRATDFYPPPRERGPEIPSTVEEHHWTARQLYPAPRRQEPATCYPPRAGEFGCYPPTAPAEHVAYPAPSAPPEPGSCYPPKPASCYPPPQAAYCYPAPEAYGPESWDRRLY